MPLTITLDTFLVEATLDRMTKQLEAFPTAMAAELTAWQTEDMHRKYPNVETPDEKTVQTQIFPRSRTTQRRRPVVRVGVKRAAPHVRVQAARPILREELFDKLCVRMGALMQDTLVWITSKSK